MQIQNIYIQNFKGFEEKEFKFNPRFNVAIGNNAIGKSTLLNAVQIALGGYLQCLNIPSSINYRRQFRQGEVFVKWDLEEKGFIKNSNSTLIKTVANFPQKKENISWTRIYQNNITTHNKKDTGELIDYVDEFITKKRIEKSIVPIVASFGTERTAAQLRKGKKAQSRRTKLEKGFLASLSEKVDFDGVLEWIHNYDEELKYEKEFPETKEAFYNALHTAIPYLKDIEYNNRDQEFRAEVIIDKNTKGKTLHSNMSDGLKAMLNLVAELSFRCVILNGFKGINAITESEGVVLIDELDMHLHPSWQRHIIDDLKAAFPKLQFIVSTHSPFIIQSIKQDELIILETDIESNGDPFRRSIEEIASTEMGVEDIPRSKAFIEMEKVAEQYYDLIESGKTSKNDTETANLRSKLNDLENKFSEDPAFVALLKSERKVANL